MAANVPIASESDHRQPHTVGTPLQTTATRRILATVQKGSPKYLTRNTPTTKC
jgi:hypothetical protein